MYSIHRLHVAFLAFVSAFLCDTTAAVRTRLTWINGIGHTLAHMEEGQVFISAKFGNKVVEWCHNPTAMAHDEDWRGYLGDLTQAGTHKMGIITAEVETLVKHLQKLIQAVGKRGVVVHIAHSQGALITALACKRLTLQQMSQMEVICFGGGACLQKTTATPFRRCMNYYSVNDPLLLLNPEALQALRSGFLNEEFCFLSPRLGDPIKDHALLNPTYAEAMEWEGLRYQQLYISRFQRFWTLLQYACMAVYAILKQRCREMVEKALRPCMDGTQRVLLMAMERVVKPTLLVLLLFADWMQGLMTRQAEDYRPISDLRGDLTLSEKETKWLS